MKTLPTANISLDQKVVYTTTCYQNDLVSIKQTSYISLAIQRNKFLKQIIDKYIKNVFCHVRVCKN